ncbi:hypothetical protein [Thermococcus sp. MAR1]|uniref:hypothetical protein n=1 Tax=Thermococcus sp. MAR1 TaxID=1638263 RepID=UPI0019804244|nr:hypothetical protein [Thermococcus sp. MAR1]
MSEVIKEHGFLRALPPELREAFELEVLRTELEKEIDELAKNLKPGFGGRASFEELERYSNEVYES